MWVTNKNSEHFQGCGMLKLNVPPPVESYISYEMTRHLICVHVNSDAPYTQIKSTQF